MLGTGELGKRGGGMEPVLSLDRKLIFKERRSGISNFLWKPKIALAFPCSRKEVGSLESTRPQGLSPRGLVGCPLGEEEEGTRIMGVCLRVGPLVGGRAGPTVSLGTNPQPQAGSEKERQREWGMKW